MTNLSLQLWSWFGNSPYNLGFLLLSVALVLAVSFLFED